MPESTLVDNDVVLKSAAFGLCEELLTRTTLDDTPPAILGATPFVARRRLARWRLRGAEGAMRSLELFLSAAVLIEPSNEELALAADLESAAIRGDLELDGGESQLLAVLIQRGCALLLTGDKRAVCAIGGLGLAEAYGRVACFEQFVSEVVRGLGVAAVRKGVCAEIGVDQAMSICFACRSPETEIVTEDVLQGLESYVTHLARMAPDVLGSSKVIRL